MIWVELFLFTYFSFVVAYNFLFSLAGLLYRIPQLNADAFKHFNKIVVLIPAYKEDAVILSVAHKALEQTYPKRYYDVIVIADSLQQATLDSLHKLDIITHEVHFEKSTKVKSLQSALNKYDSYDVVVILDADNIMNENFLEIINGYINGGWKAIQGQRAAKNRNTSFAILDGVSERISNHINRAGANALGLSSPIIGSGMAYNYTLLKEIMNSIKSIGGFDKELQVRVLQRNEKILYLKSAIVLDEKVETPEVFKNQRRRWISSHYIYAKKFFVTGMAGILKGNVSLFNIAVLLSIQLPRVLAVGLLFLLSVVTILFHEMLNLPFWTWPALFVVYLISFMMAIPVSFYNLDLLKAILQLPRAFITMFFVHFKLKGADEKFIHTPHGVQTSDLSKRDK